MGAGRPSTRCGHHGLPLGTVYDIKLDGDGNLIRFTQQLGLDHTEAVSQLESIWMMAALLELWQIDFTTAFLNSRYLHEVSHRESGYVVQGWENG